MTHKPAVERNWRGRTRPERADEYEAYNRALGVPPLEEAALAVQLFREDREEETWFTTIPYWADIVSTTRFTKGDLVAVHPRDAELLIELPERIQVHRIVVDMQNLR